MNPYVSNHPTIHADAHLIDMDSIGHYILEEGKEPICHEVRQKLTSIFGAKAQNKNGFMNVQKISFYIFRDHGYKVCFDDIMREPMMYLLRKQLLDAKGTEKKKSIVIIVGALLCEAEGLSEFNNNLILVDTPKINIIARLKKKRNYSEEMIHNRMKAQAPFDVKLKIAKNEIENKNSGNIWVIKNGNDSNQNEIFLDIVNALHLER
jgi:dephospho-CoA kinase